MSTYTTTVPATRSAVSDPFNPTGPLVVCGSSITSGIVDTMDGEIRHYAGGLVEGVAFDQDDRSHTVVLRHLSSTDRDNIVQWRGRPVLFRNASGVRFFAFYLSCESTPVYRTTPDDGTLESYTWDVTVQFVRVSVDETLIPG